ncbi:hypothetical protein SSP35_23_00470 [Streptomyces sp. NBRC 110611]|nr:hypothetical protein SSP35_23_00470 [Streptomyces sp. NBRC 110611]
MREAVTALHAGIDILSDEIVRALRAQLPSYAAVSAEELRPRVTASLRNGLSLVQRVRRTQCRSGGEGRPSGSGRSGQGGDPAYAIPAGHLDEVTALARALPVEDIISAYRIGTDLAWRRFGEEVTARHGTAEDLLPIAEALRVWVDTNTLHIVRSCRSGPRTGTVAYHRRTALVRALLLGEANVVKADGTGTDGLRADGLRTDGTGTVAAAAYGGYDWSTALRIPFRARLPGAAVRSGDGVRGSGDGARGSGDGARGSDEGVLARAVDLLRPWLALDAAGKPLVTIVDGDAAGLLAGRPGGLCRGLVVGLGAPAPASGLAAEFARATLALRAAVGCGLVGTFTHEELGLRATVVAMPAVGEQLVRLRLAPLAERGEDGAQLEEAAAAYLRQGLRLEAAARTLYVHPNTLRNRLRRFEEITGTSLRDPADLAEIWWALTHRQVHDDSPAG